MTRHTAKLTQLSTNPIPGQAISRRPGPREYCCSKVTDHDTAPEESDCGEEHARSDLAAHDRCGRLKKDVGDEEQQRNDRLEGFGLAMATSRRTEPEQRSRRGCENLRIDQLRSLLRPFQARRSCCDLVSFQLYTPIGSETRTLRWRRWTDWCDRAGTRSTWHRRWE